MNSMNSRTNTVCYHPACDRAVREEWRFSRNKVHRDYCSLFCRESVSSGQVTRDAQAHRKFQQPASCVLCGTDFFRTYNYHRSNQRYCSTECYDEISHRKHGRRNLHLLTILSEVGGEDGLTSADLADYMDRTIWKVRGAAGVSGIIRRWVKSGVVQKVSRTGAALPTYRLCPDWLSSGIPLGTLV
jgi:hypothetical protein